MIIFFVDQAYKVSDSVSYRFSNIDKDFFNCKINSIKDLFHEHYLNEYEKHCLFIRSVELS